MPIDPRIRPGYATPSTTIARPAPQVSTPQPQPQPQPNVARPTTGFTTNSTFQPTPNRNVGRVGTNDDSVGRRRGTNDDGVGRTRGTNDDGVGRKAGTNDDGVGRKSGTNDDGVGRKAGTNDDGVGRKAGTNDDGVGHYEMMAALVGRTETPDAVALRNAINQRLETPSFLKKGSESVASQVFKFAQASLKLSQTQVGQLTTVLKNASSATAGLVGALVEKCPEALTSVDSKGQTFLANLARFAAQPMNASLNADTTKSELMEAMLRDVANPNRIDQGDAPTCTVTSMQYELVADEPAEYVRLMTDLTGPQGRAKMRGGGELMLQAGDGSNREGRSISQTLFQSTAMEYGNGKNLDFNPSAGGSFDAEGNMVQRGLKPAQQTQMLRQLFGVNYRSELFQTEAEGAKVLEKLRTLDTRGQQNRPVLLQIDQGDFNHAVTFEKVAEQRVFFRDPYGELRSMPEAQFKTFVVGLHAPKDLGIIT